MARDSWGEVVKLVSAPIASGAPEPVVDGLNAMLAASATGPGSAAVSPQEKLGSTALFGSGSIETRIYLYETATEKAVVYITIYTDGNGKLIDLDVSTIRFPKYSRDADGPDD